MRVGCIVIDDGVDDPTDGHLPFDGVEEADELLVPMVLQRLNDVRQDYGLPRQGVTGLGFALPPCFLSSLGSSSEAADQPIPQAPRRRLNSSLPQNGIR